MTSAPGWPRPARARQGRAERTRPAAEERTPLETERDHELIEREHSPAAKDHQPQDQCRPGLWSVDDGGADRGAHEKGPSVRRDLHLVRGSTLDWMMTRRQKLVTGRDAMRHELERRVMSERRCARRSRHRHD